MDFIQLTKVAEDQQIIYARAICEEPDRSGQVADYLASKAAFQKWADETKAASMGKSMGNIRVMHKPDVAGRVIDIQYDDINKAIDVAIQVDRPDVWKMCKVGAYTGLSVGGSYGRKWADPQYPGMERYEPKLSELSIVDRPCVPSATFQLLKADGNVEERHFANVAFDADIIGTLKSMAAEHNAEHQNEWAKAKLSDLKKVYKRGNLESLTKDDGNSLSDGLSRVQQFLSVLAADSQDCDDKDLLNKSHPIIALRKNKPHLVDPNSTGNKVGAATAAAITGASLGYAGRAAGKTLAVPVIPAMKASPKFRRAINAGDDMMTAAKRGIKNTARTGSFRAGAKTAVRTFKAIQNGTIKSKGLLGITRSYRGAASVPGAVIGTGLGALSFAHSYKARRLAQKQNAEIHNAIVSQMNKAYDPSKHPREYDGKYAGKPAEKTSRFAGGAAGAVGGYLVGTKHGRDIGSKVAYKGTKLVHAGINAVAGHDWKRDIKQEHNEWRNSVIGSRIGHAHGGKIGGAVLGAVGSMVGAEAGSALDRYMRRRRAIKAGKLDQYNRLNAGVTTRPNNVKQLKATASRANTAAKKVGQAHQFISQFNKFDDVMEKVFSIPGAKAFELGTLAATTAAGAVGGGIAAYKGNPYRDKDGKFTNKENAAIVVGLGATAGAAAGFGGGVALTHRGLSHAYDKAYDTAHKQLDRFLQAKSVFEGRGPQHYGLDEAVKNVRDTAKAQFDALEDTHSDIELRAKHNPYKAMAADAVLSSVNPERAKYLTASGNPNTAGRMEVIHKAKVFGDLHNKLKLDVNKAKDALAAAGKGLEGNAKDSAIKEASNAHEAAQNALDEFESKLAPYSKKAEELFERDKVAASKNRTLLVQRLGEGINYGVNGVSRSWADLYKESAKLRADGVPDKDADYVIKQFRKNHEKVFQAEHARVLLNQQERAKKLGFNRPATGAERFARVSQRLDQSIAKTRNRAESIKRARENLLGAKIAVQMHRMTSRMVDASRPMFNEANAAIKIARHAMTPNSTLREAYSGAKRKVGNVVKQGLFHIASKEPLYVDNPPKDAAGKPIPYGHKIITRKKKTILGQIPDVNELHMGALIGGITAASTLVYRDDKKKWHKAKIRDIKVNQHMTNLNNWHFSATIPSRSNPQNKIYLAGVQRRGGDTQYLAPGQSAFSNDTNPGQGGGQQGGQRTFPVIGLEADDYKALNGWRGIAGQNQGVVVKKSEYGTQYRNHNLKNLTPEQNATANNASRAMQKAVERTISAVKSNGGIKQDTFWPLVRQITGAEPIQVGSEKYFTSSMTARDQANAFKRLFPGNSGLNPPNPFDPEGKKTTATALMNLINKPLSDGGVANMNDSANATAMKGAVHAFMAGQFITPEDEKRLMGAIDSRSNRDSRPGYRNTTGTQEPKYIPSSNKDYDETVDRISAKHPDISKVVIANRLDTYLKRSKREHPELDEHDHLNEAYVNTVSQLDAAYGTF